MTLPAPDAVPATATATDTAPVIAFIGGGNMASAILGGLLRQGHPAERLRVVEPYAPTREALLRQHGLAALPEAGPALADAAIVVWAVKPQTFKDAAAQTRPHLAAGALHLSVAAGIRSDSLAAWLGSERIVRSMPNTPALIGQGISGLYARAGVDAAARAAVERILAGTGACIWVEQERLLDAVTALSGSGPAYVFYFLEAMAQAGVGMGLSAAQAHQLAVATFAGAAELARRSDEPPAVLRERVTSKGGTTYAALQSLAKDGVDEAFMRAMQAAEQRARELGDEFGA